MSAESPAAQTAGLVGALQVVGDLDAVLAPLDAGGVEAQVGQLRDPSRAVDDEVGLDRLLRAGVLEGDLVATVGGPHVHDGGGAAQVDADLSAAVDEELDEVGVEALQRALAAVDDDR